MTSVEITSRDTLDPTIVEGDLAEVTHAMNIAVASGRQFVICEEKGGGPVALEVANITRMREKPDAFAGI